MYRLDSSGRKVKSPGPVNTDRTDREGEELAV